MQMVHVYIHVKPEAVDAFREATLRNARFSVREPGIVRFDLIQQTDDPTRFVLMEIYRSPEASEAHRATEHFTTWRDTVAEMMAEPRTAMRYTTVFPEATGWELPS